MPISQAGPGNRKTGWRTGTERTETTVRGFTTSCPASHHLHLSRLGFSWVISPSKALLSYFLLFRTFFPPSPFYFFVHTFSLKVVTRVDINPHVSLPPPGRELSPEMQICGDVTTAVRRGCLCVPPSHPLLFRPSRVMHYSTMTHLGSLKPPDPPPHPPSSGFNFPLMF